jgi:hypothetical protein
VRRLLPLVAALCATLVVVIGMFAALPPASAQEGGPPTTDPPTTDPPTTSPTTTPTTAPPTTRPPATSPTTRPPVQTAPPPPPPDDGGGDADEPSGGDEQAVVDATAAQAPANMTFTTTANLLVPGNGLSGAQATTTTTEAPTTAGNDANDETRTIWMIIAALAGVGVLVALLTWRYWLLTRPGLTFDDDEDPDGGDDLAASPMGVGPPPAGRRGRGARDRAVAPRDGARSEGRGRNTGRRPRGDGGDPFWDEPVGAAPSPAGTGALPGASPPRRPGAAPPGGRSAGSGRRQQAPDARRRGGPAEPRRGGPPARGQRGSTGRPPADRGRGGGPMPGGGGAQRRPRPPQGPADPDVDMWDDRRR